MVVISFILLALGFAVLIYTNAPELVKYAQNHPHEDPNRVLFDFVKNTINDFKRKKNVYTAYICLDEYGAINANIVNDVFSRFHELFNVFYFIHWQDCGDRVIYLFKCQDTKEPLAEYDLWKCCCGLCGEILSNYWHKNCPYTVLPQDYYSISFYNGNLTISLAKNDDGARENTNILAFTRLTYEQSNNGKNNDDLNEDWKNDPKR